MFTDEKGKFARNSETLIIYASNNQDVHAKGKDSGSQIKPSTPVTNPKNIVAGMKARTRIFAGRATSESRPIL